MQERLQKIIARAGVASRRKAERLIRDGKVTVNGVTVTELGTRADPRRDHIRVAGRPIRPEPLESYAVHKPRGVLSSASDERGRPVVTGLVRSRRRLYPAGRLDFHSEGLMILTNDGELARAVTRAGHLEKVYHVKVRGEVPGEKLEHFLEGIRSEGERLRATRVRSLRQAENCWYEVVLAEGKKRQIRRMFEAVGHPVLRLRRIAIGPVTLGSLSPGESRPLTPREITRMKGQG